LIKSFRAKIERASNDFPRGFNHADDISDKAGNSRAPAHEPKKIQWLRRGLAWASRNSETKRRPTKGSHPKCSYARM